MIDYNRRIRKKPIADMNVVPYIDVMLVLLVIFMITAPLLKQGLNVNLPQTTAQALPSQSELPIIITIDAHNDYYLNTIAEPKKSIPLNHLMEILAQLWQTQSTHDKNKKIYIEADRTIPYGHVVELMGLLKNAGIEQVNLITMPPIQKSK
jgi:biopolymer transport protein TolR